MTSSNGSAFDRLDRIETLVEANPRAIAETRASIEQLATVAQTALSIAQSNREGLQQTEQLTRRNATKGLMVQMFFQ